MNLNTVNGVEVKGIACAIPKQHYDLVEYVPNLLNEKTAKRMAKGTGFASLRITPDAMTTADLVAEAAKPVLADTNRDNIGALVFVTQTPDYVLPATSHVLQERLGLRQDTFCLDINEGCSGYVTGLYTAAMLAKQQSTDVLLLCGDTISKLTSPDDRATRCIFGDAGTATLVSTEGMNNIPFAFSSYGERADAIVMENSRHRKVESPKNSGYLYLDGEAIMEFALNDTLEMIKQFISEMALSKDDITLYACHQANKLILNSLADALKVDREKVPFTAAEIGNESSASIPLVLTQKFGEADMKCTLCAGFGVGLSVGLALADFSSTKFYGVSEL